MKCILPLITLIILIISCHDNQKAKEEGKIAPVIINKVSAATKTAALFTRDMVVNEKDPSCYMSLHDGIGDTAHYQGKTYGFCSKECKNEFLRRPDYYVK